MINGSCRIFLKSNWQLFFFMFLDTYRHLPNGMILFKIKLKNFYDTTLVINKPT